VRDLRPSLKVDETGFLIVAGPSHSHPRDYLIYAVLDEIQKAATAILRWAELFQGSQTKSDTPEEAHVERMVFEAVLNEQSLWTRKLVEALTTLICFQTTNEPAYYRHYLLLSALRERRATADDLAHFYACPNRNIEASVARLAEEAAELEASGALDFQRTWYLARTRPALADELKRVHPGRVFSTERRRLTKALSVCSASEKIVLGFSYDRTFGRASREMHFGPPGLRPRTTANVVSGALDDVGVLGLNLIRRVQLLMGVVPEGANATVKDLFETNELPAALVERHTRGNAEVGDFVLAYGDPGQVIEVTDSDLGYRSYRVRYVAEQPLPDIDDDWFPAQEVLVLFSHTKLLADLEERVGKDVSPEAVERLRTTFDEAARLDALRDAFVIVWQSGLREWVQRNWFGREPPRPPATAAPEPPPDPAESQPDGLRGSSERGDA
jgi:hypothetical protein